MTFKRGAFHPEVLYKLFTERRLREVVLRALVTQLVRSGMCLKAPKVTLCLATGKIASATDRVGLHKYFERRGWRIFDEAWIGQRLAGTADADYENDIAFVVAKVLKRFAAGAATVAAAGG